MNGSKVTLGNGLKHLSGLPLQSTGGILEFSFIKDLQGQTTEMRRCTALVTFPREFPTAVQLWTAKHCLWPAWTENLRVQLFTKEGYVEIPLTSPLLDWAAKARKESELLPFSARIAFLQAVNAQIGDPLTITKDARMKCHKIDFESLSDWQSNGVEEVCFSLEDMTSIVANIPTTMTASQKAALAEARSVETRIEEAWKTIPSYTSQRKISENGAAAALDARFARSIASLAADIDSCTRADPQLAPTWCGAQVTPAIKTLYGKVFGGAQNVSSLFSSGRRGSSVSEFQAESRKWSALAQEAQAFSDKSFEGLWKFMTSANADAVIVHTNLFRANGSLLGFQWVPSFLTRKGVNLDIVNDGTNDGRAVIVKTPLNARLISWQSGDSGSVVTFRNAPFAVVSYTVHARILQGSLTRRRGVTPRPDGCGHRQEAGSSEAARRRRWL